jgi:hypothetical protein
MSEASKVIGGFYFKDMRGETLAAASWKHFNEALLGPRASDLHRAVIASIEFVEPYTNVESFLAKFEVIPGTVEGRPEPGGRAQFANRHLRKLWELFQERMQELGKEPEKTKLGEVVQYLRCFYAVLDLESNRPYKFWYSRTARLNLGKKTKAFVMSPPTSLGLSWYEKKLYLFRAKVR